MRNKNVALEVSRPHLLSPPVKPSTNHSHPALAAKTSYLHVGYYLDNWKMPPAFAPQKQDDGSFVFPHYAPPGMGKMPYVDAVRDTGLFVKALILKNPAGMSMVGYSEALSNNEYCEIWRSVHGVEVRSKYLGYDDLVSVGMPEWLALETFETGVYVAKFGHTGGDLEVKGPEELGVDVGALRTVEESIRVGDWSSVL